MPNYLENLIHFCNLVLEHYELHAEKRRMFVRSMTRGGSVQNVWGCMGEVYYALVDSPRDYCDVLS